MIIKGERNGRVISLMVILFLFVFVLPARAVTVTWAGGGIDNLASNPANWTGSRVPQYGDDVVFNATSTKDCTWDIAITLASLTITSGYTGKVTKTSGITLTLAKSLSPPNVPSGLTASVISSSQINLAWTDNSINETGFKIERKTGVDGTYSQIAAVLADVTAYSDTGLSAGITYYYRVRAYNGIGDSAYSNEANATTIVIPPPTTVTDPASNVTHNSARLNATVNPNGSETTAYFELGTDTNYGLFTSSPISLGSGTNDVIIMLDIIGFSPETTYHYRVVATNAYGTSYGSDMSFTTPPITQTITSPLNSATINRPDVMVRGTVVNSTGNETGVTVNGIVATIYNGEFFVNHVSLEEGQNNITATATDTTGNTAKTSITVNAVTTTPYIELHANIESGIPPLTTYFSASTSIPNSVLSYQMDYEGDSTIDYSGTTFDNISFTYTTEGIYYPTLIVTDTTGITYSDTIAIVVLNATQLDALLRAKWEAMTNSLSIGDTTTALTYISSDTRATYEDMFNALTGQLPSIMSTRTEFNLISIKDTAAKYELVTLENGTTYSYEVIFIRDTNGIWMIRDY